MTSAQTEEEAVSMFVYGAPDEAFALAFIELDSIQRIRISRGSRAASVILDRLCEVLRRTLGDRGHVGRWGGDEIIAIVDRSHRESAEAILLELAATLRKSGPMEKHTASIGAAMYPMDGASFVELLAAADNRLLEVKSRGGNDVLIGVDPADDCKMSA